MGRSKQDSLKKAYNHIVKIALSVLLVFALVNLGCVIWQTNLVFAEINKQNPAPTEDHIPAAFSLENLDQELINSYHIFFSKNTKRDTDKERLLAHTEIDSPPPEVLA